MLRQTAAEGLSRFVERTGEGFPAIAAVWQALACRGRLLADGGFCWGLLPLRVCEAAGGDPLRALPLAVSVECLIAALDTLDDVEDQDSPSALWQTTGIPTAINVATFLLFSSQLAIADLSRRGVPPDVVADVGAILAAAGARACAGQQVDLEQASSETFSESGYLDMISRKSAGLVEAICRAGATVASAAPADVERFARFGRNLGIAMQISNDLAGLTSERAERNDLSARKRTLPVLFALERAPEPLRRELQALFATERSVRLGVDEIERAREILEWSGSLQFATVVADTFWERALTCLEGPESARSDSLRELLGDLRCSGEK